MTNGNGNGDVEELFNPTEVDSNYLYHRIDLDAAFDYARLVGGPALRNMTFAERGVTNKIASVLHEKREYLLEVSRDCNGATRDSKFDVDGATVLCLPMVVMVLKWAMKFQLDGTANRIMTNARHMGTFSIAT